VIEQNSAGFDCCPGRKKHFLVWRRLIFPMRITKRFECLFCGAIWGLTLKRTKGEIDLRERDHGELSATLPPDPQAHDVSDPRSRPTPGAGSEGNHRKGTF
jgi:hypothetical protein